jgi:hypothetical protein
LNSPDVVRYLDSREMMLEAQKTAILEAFQILKQVATITEASAARTSDYSIRESELRGSGVS